MHVCAVLMCVNIFAGACVYVNIYTCGGLRLTSGGFLNCSPLYLLTGSLPSV